MDAFAPEWEELTCVDRQNTDCIKWDGLENTFGESGLMALWVADMDFQAPRCVREALAAWAEHGAFGYYKQPPSYLDAFIKWERERHGYEAQREHIRFSSGVVTAIYWLLHAASRPGDSIMLLTPVYYPFFNAIENTGRKIVRSELVNTGGVYTVDFADFEAKIVESQAKAFILSSPHNPVGRVWDREELTRLLDICRRHGVAVISDEIHQDLMIGEKPNIPAATIDPAVTTVTAASKTFNLAGLQNSFAVIPDDRLRAAYDKMGAELAVRGGNMAGYIAARAAYEGGGPWLDVLLAQLRENDRDLRDIIEKGLPKAVISPLEGTYLAWIDLSAYLKPGTAKEVIQGKCRLAVDYGDWFGGEAYQSFIRVNLATRNENIREAARRIVAALA